jgi:CRP/FNR family transcriptional regulator, cyclic AMP receptor protein
MMVDARRTPAVRLGTVDNPLADVDVFQRLSPPALDALQRRARRRAFRKGEVIFHRDDPGSSLYLVISGRVRVLVASDGGEELTLAILRAGDCFGEMALLSEGERTATVVALEATETLAIQRDDFLDALAGSPGALVSLLQMVVQRLVATNAQLLAASYLDVPSRLARRLLELAETDGVVTPAGTRLELALTQQALASMLGASRESTGRALSDFRERGLIRTENHRIVLLRPELLAAAGA